MNIKPIEIDGELFKNPYALYYIDNLAKHIVDETHDYMEFSIKSNARNSGISKIDGTTRITINITGFHVTEYD